MRVISQNGTMDFPYDNSLVFLHESCIKGNTCVEIQLYGGTEIDTVAEYSNEEKALKAMEMLREQHEKVNFLKTIINTEKGASFIRVLPKTDFDKMTQNYFQFPKDDEVEL